MKQKDSNAKALYLDPGSITLLCDHRRVSYLICKRGSQECKDNMRDKMAEI